jgi:hypothetical protein
MSLYIKDTEKPTGWKVVSYRKKNLEEGAPVTADGMDEGAEEGGDDQDPEMSQREAE